MPRQIGTLLCAVHALSMARGINHADLVARAGARTAQLGVAIVTQYDGSRAVKLCAPLCGSSCGVRRVSL